MNITNAELESLKKTKNKKEWNATCDAIKKARAGQYPPDWFAKVVLSGMASEALLRFETSL